MSTSTHSRDDAPIVPPHAIWMRTLRRLGTALLTLVLLAGGITGPGTRVAHAEQPADALSVAGDPPVVPGGPVILGFEYNPCTPADPDTDRCTDVTYTLSWDGAPGGQESTARIMSDELGEILSTGSWSATDSIVSNSGGSYEGYQLGFQATTIPGSYPYTLTAHYPAGDRTLTATGTLEVGAAEQLSTSGTAPTTIPGAPYHYTVDYTLNPGPQKLDGPIRMSGDENCHGPYRRIRDIQPSHQVEHATAAVDGCTYRQVGFTDVLPDDFVATSLSLPDMMEVQIHRADGSVEVRIDTGAPIALTGTSRVTSITVFIPPRFAGTDVRTGTLTIDGDYPATAAPGTRTNSVESVYDGVRVAFASIDSVPKVTRMTGVYRTDLRVARPRLTKQDPQGDTLAGATADAVYCRAGTCQTRSVQVTTDGAALDYAFAALGAPQDGDTLTVTETAAPAGFHLDAAPVTATYSAATGWSPLALVLVDTPVITTSTALTTTTTATSVVPTTVSTVTETVPTTTETVTTTTGVPTTEVTRPTVATFTTTTESTPVVTGTATETTTVGTTTETVSHTSFSATATVTTQWSSVGATVTSTPLATTTPTVVLTPIDVVTPTETVNPTEVVHPTVTTTPQVTVTPTTTVRTTLPGVTIIPPTSITVTQPTITFQGSTTTVVGATSTTTAPPVTSSGRPPAAGDGGLGTGSLGGPGATGPLTGAGAFLPIVAAGLLVLGGGLWAVLSGLLPGISLPVGLQGAALPPALAALFPGSSR